MCQTLTVWSVLSFLEHLMACLLPQERWGCFSPMNGFIICAWKMGWVASRIWRAPGMSTAPKIHRSSIHQWKTLGLQLFDVCVAPVQAGFAACFLWAQDSRRMFAPLGLHGDGGQFQQNDSINVISFRSLLSSWNVATSQLLLIALPKGCINKNKDDDSKDTMHHIWKVLVWSLEATFYNKFPEMDHMGKDWPTGSWRAKMAGHPLSTAGYRGFLYATQADGEYMANEFHLNGASMEQVCWNCDANKTSHHCFLEGNSCGPQGHITNWAFGVSSASCVWPDIQIWYPSCPWGRIGSPPHCQCSLWHGDEITWSWHSGGEVEEPSEQNSPVLWRAGHWVWAPSQKVPYVLFLLSQKQVGHFPIPQWHQGQAMQVAGSSVPPDLWGQPGNRRIFTAQVQMLQTFEHCVWGDGFCWDAPQPNWCQNFLQGREQLPATLQQAFSSLPPARCINVEYHSENAPLPALGAPIQVVQSKNLFLLLWWNNGGPYVCLGTCLPQWHHSPFGSTQNSLEI